METKIFDSNGTSISYTKNGQGENSRAIIFVHGNSEDNTLFAEISEKLAGEKFVVIAPDTRSHGKSSKVRRISYGDIADDIVPLIMHEELEKPILFGFSDGGIVGLLLAIKYPNILSKLIVAGVNLSPKGINGRWRVLIRLHHFFSRSDKMRLMLSDYNITADDLKQIKIPTIALYAEKDMVKKSHSELIVNNVANSEMKIIKGENHGSYVFDNQKLYDIITDDL